MVNSLNSSSSTPQPAGSAPKLGSNLLLYKQSTSAGEDAQKIIIYGAPGTGKTLYAGGASSKFEVLWFDLENGKDSLLANLSEEQLSRITYIPLADSSDNPVAAPVIAALFQYGKGSICHEHSQFNCARCKPDARFNIDLSEWTADKNRVIVIDSATQLSWSAYFRALSQLNKSIEDGDQTSFDVWRIQGAYLAKIFSAIQASPHHVITISHEHEVEYPDKSKKLVPSVGTKTQKVEFSKYFGHKIRTAIKMGLFTRQTIQKAGASYEIGSRWNIDASQDGVTICDFLVRPAQAAPLATGGSPLGSSLATKPPTLGGAKPAPAAPNLSGFTLPKT